MKKPSTDKHCQKRSQRKRKQSTLTKEKVNSAVKLQAKKHEPKPHPRAGLPVAWTIKGRGGYHAAPDWAEARQNAKALYKSLNRGQYKHDPKAVLLRRALKGDTKKRIPHVWHHPVRALKRQCAFVRYAPAIFDWSKPVYRASLVTDHFFAVGSLDERMFDHLAVLVKRICIEAKLNYAIGAYDLSANAQNDFYGTYVYAPQVMLFYQTDNKQRVDRIIAKHFVATQRVPKPKFVQKINTDLAAFAYALKPTFERRIARPDKNGKLRACSEPLTVAIRNEIAFAMKDMKLRDRLFLYNVKLVKNQSGLLELVKQPLRGTIK